MYVHATSQAWGTVIIHNVARPTRMSMLRLKLGAQQVRKVNKVATTTHFFRTAFQGILFNILADNIRPHKGQSRNQELHQMSYTQLTQESFLGTPNWCLFERRLYQIPANSREMIESL